MSEPTTEQIAMIAAHIYAGGTRGIKTAVYTAIKIWDQAAAQLKERIEHEQKTEVGT